MVTILAVIVLYKRNLNDSPTVQTLFEAARTCAHTDVTLKTVVYDNTPGESDTGFVPSWITYKRAPDNPGLSKTYNEATALAGAIDCDWLMTLDQDTALPVDYLTEMVDHCRLVESDPQVAAVVPQVLEGDRIISPFIFAASALPRLLPRGFQGVTTRATYAINSAAVLRVSALNEIGGYDPMFPLDVSDLDVFHRLYRAGKKVFVAGNIKIAHEYGMLNIQKRMSVKRYKSMLNDECAFWDIYMGWLARSERLLRLVGRAIRESSDEDDLPFREVTVAEIKRRLFTMRSLRIAEWTEFASARAQTGVTY